MSASRQEGQPKRTSVLGDRLAALGFTSYDDYLRSCLWATRRQTYFTQGGSTNCFICTSSRHLNIHHRTYRNLGDEKHEDLVTLCEECHHAIHEYIKTHTGYVPLDEAHIRFKQSKEAKQTPKPKPLSRKEQNLRKRQARNKRRKTKSAAREQRLTAQQRRAIKAREAGRIEHEIAETRRKKQEAIQKAHDDLGRPLTYAEAKTILNLT